LTDSAFGVVFDEDVRERVAWSDRDGVARVATIPRVTFVRRIDAEGGDHR
jgi:hypothetical protein